MEDVLPLYEEALYSLEIWLAHHITSVIMQDISYVNDNIV